MTSRLRLSSAAAALLLLVLAAPDAFGQSIPTESSLTQRYARPGVPTQTVYIWGAVGSPGVWQVEQDVDLVELLSAARLSGVGTVQSGTRQRNTVRVYRKDGTGRNLVYDASLDDLLSPDATYPMLQDQDVIEVETVTRNSFGWREATSIVGTVAGLVLVTFQILERTR